MPRIHLIGICGTAMATLAAMLKARGVDVQGSDHAVYPPMSDFLAREGITVLDGYRAEHVTSDLDSVIVGNETIYRNKVLYKRENVQDLIDKIQRVKRSVRVPVTTAEVWDVWLDHPELVSAVDYLAVHILPYWEGMPGSAAVDHAIKVYEQLRHAYPGKRIVIAEFGWPSAGLNRKEAMPSHVEKRRGNRLLEPVTADSPLRGPPLNANRAHRPPSRRGTRRRPS